MLSDDELIIGLCRMNLGAKQTATFPCWHSRHRIFEYLYTLCKDKRLRHALQFAEDMEQNLTFITRDNAYYLLQLCEENKDLNCCRRVQTLMAHVGLDSIAVLGDHLIRLFAYYGNLHEASQTFNIIAVPSEYSWAAIILAYANLGQGRVAFELYHRMQSSGMKGNSYVYVAVLKSCSMTRDVVQGKITHDQIIKEKLLSEVIVGNALIDMYVKSGSLEQANNVFNNIPHRDVVSWNTMIAGYAQHGPSPWGLEYLERMQQDGIPPNVISWNTMIGGYVEHGEGLLALQCFEKMVDNGNCPNDATFLSVLKACIIIGSIGQGRFIHQRTAVNEFNMDTVVGTTLVDMYAKCGSLQEAQATFFQLKNPNVVSWNALMAGYAQHGENFSVLKCFKGMQLYSTRPDEVSFTCVLTACGHAGLVDEGHWYFKTMKEYYDLTPTVSHQTCMVDLLGHAGCLYEAEVLVHAALQTDIVGLTSFLSACNLHGSRDSGLYCFDRMVLLDSFCAPGFVLMSNIYTCACLGKDTEQPFRILN